MNGTKPATLADDLFPAYESLPAEKSATDSTLEALLLLLDKYAKEQELLAVEFKEGFIDLARANYSGSKMNKPFGSDYWDERVQATKRVMIVNDTVELMGSKEKIEETAIEPSSDENESHLRNRTKKNVKKGEETKAMPTKKKGYDPINMFGVLVPHQLLQSQTHFNSSVKHVVNIVNVRIELERLSKELAKERQESTTRTRNE